MMCTCDHEEWLHNKADAFAPCAALACECNEYRPTIDVDVFRVAMEPFMNARMCEQTRSGIKGALLATVFKELPREYYPCVVVSPRINVRILGDDTPEDPSLYHVSWEGYARVPKP